MDSFIGEIRIVPFQFAPQGWAFCDGQTMPIAQNTALFSILGVTYGGDGRTNFALPNLQGRFPMHPGQGAGLSSYKLGQNGGSKSVALLASEMPSHRHELKASSKQGALQGPTNNALANSANGSIYHTNSTSGLANMASVGDAGGNQPHNNIHPFLVLNFVISLNGEYPVRP